MTQSRQFKSTETITTRHRALTHISVAIIFALFALVLHHKYKNFSITNNHTATVNDQCVHIVNPVTVSFVESECDVLSVYVKELLLTYLSSRRSAS